MLPMTEHRSDQGAAQLLIDNDSILPFGLPAEAQE
jgi:hypothetical protein